MKVPPGARERTAEAACLLLALLALHPLLTPGHLWGHDTGAHLFRLVEVARALGEGVFYPRFVPDAYGGLGGPILNFNPVAPYYLPALLVLAGAGPIAALKISSGVLMLAGGVAMRILARPHAGRIGAAVAGLAYVYLPYRIANLYVRMAYSELAAMVVLPLAMAAARRAAARPTPRRVASAGIASGALLAVHFPSSVLGLPLVVLYVLATARGGRRLRSLGAVAASILLAAALGAFSWLPAWMEQAQTHYEESTEGYDNYRNHFLEPSQLLSPRWGFGPSLPGSRDGMSFQLGWAHLLALAGGVAAAARIRRLRALTAFCAAVVLGGSLLTLSASRPVWDLIPVLQDVQFPWRILMVIGIATSLAAGAAVRLGGGPERSSKDARTPDEPRRKKRPARHRSGAPPASAAPAAAAGRAWPGLAVPAALAVLLAAACWPYLQARRGEGKNEDFTPEAIRARYFGELKFQPKEVSRMMYRPEGPRAALLEGGEARIVEERTHRMKLEVEARAAATLRVHLFNTPGWRAAIDGREVQVRGEPGTAMTLVSVPAGRHVVALEFGDTPVRRAGWLLSGAGLLAAAGAIAAGRRPRERPAAGTV